MLSPSSGPKGVESLIAREDPPKGISGICCAFNGKFYF